MTEAQLKAAFTQDQLALAIAIGTETSPLKDRVRVLFERLPDPLLDAADVGALLHVPDRTGVQAALNDLVNEKVFEMSTETSRPLDVEDVKLYRLANVPFQRLKLMALESRLPNGTTRLQFTCDGRLIRSIAKVDRLDSFAGRGNQRSEIEKHIQKIAEGISGGTQVPNPILLVILNQQIAAVDDADAPESFVRIKPLDEYQRVPHGDMSVVQEYRPVQLDFPFRRAAFDEEKSALLVDGQQRTAALSLVDVDKVPQCFLSVNAEIASPESAQQIFLVANSTAKIETQFSRALLAVMDGTPAYLAREKPMAVAAKKLALEDPNSPFYQIVQYPGAKQPKAESGKPKRTVVAYNSLFQIVSLFAASVIIEAHDAETLALLVSRGFNLVKSTWGNAWGMKPGDSRLMHGAGLRGMGGWLVAKIEQHYGAAAGDLASKDLWEHVEASLKRLKPNLVWTMPDLAGATTTAQNFFKNHILDKQNTPQDIVELTQQLRGLDARLTADAEGKGKKKS